MAIHTESLHTKRRCEMIEITSRVRALVRAAGVAVGMVVVFVPHTTAAVTINENADPDVKHDLLGKLESLIPQREAYYQHG